MNFTISASVGSVLGVLIGGAGKTAIYYWLGVGGFLLLIFLVAILFTVFKGKD